MHADGGGAATGPPGEVLLPDADAAGRAPATPGPKASPPATATDVRADVDLDVVDARTGEHLGGVVVVQRVTRAPLLQRENLAHPGAFAPSHLLVEGGRSPVRVDVGGDPRPLWVGAAGYGWVRLAEPPAGGPTRVELVPGGTLHVQLAGFEPGSAVAFRGYDAEGAAQRVEVGPVTDGELSLAGVPAGALRVQLEFLTRPGTPICEAADVVVPAGGDVRVALHWPGDLQPLPSGTVAGFLALPPEVAELGLEDELFLSLDPVEATREHLRRGEDRRTLAVGGMATVDGAPDLRTFELPDVAPAPHRLILHPLGHVTEVDVMPDEGTLVHVEPTGLARTILDLVDSQTGAPVVVERLQVSLAGVHRNAWSRHSQETGAYEVLSVPGELVLILRDSTYGSREERFHAGPGWNTARWEIAPVVDALLRVSVAGDRAPVDAAFWAGIEIEGETEANEVVSRRRRVAGPEGPRDDLRIEVSAPGRYVFRFPDVAGYAPVEERVLDVRRDDANLLEVELVAN